MPISLDHQPYLGDRVELIAAEKAGIMKRKHPVVIGKQEYDCALDVLMSTAERLGCPTSVFGQDYMAHEEYGRLVYQDEFGLADLPLPRLPGATNMPMPPPPSARSRLRVSSSPKR
jgi:dihydrofolate synthase/folylpolyglutamate synthase